jgi:hypothetical protein
MLYDTIAELKSANEEILKINHFNFYILDEDEKFECESIKIYGLPFGIDFNTYYKMAMLRDIKSLKPSTGTTSINFSAEVEKATNIAISKIKEGLIKSGM